MRRDLVMILVLLVAAVGVVPWAHGRVNNDRANVEFGNTITVGMWI